MALLRALFLITTGLLLLGALQGAVADDEQPAPTESECRPYIEKALKQLGTSETSPETTEDGSSEQAPSEEQPTTDESAEATSDAGTIPDTAPTSAEEGQAASTEEGGESVEGGESAEGEESVEGGKSAEGGESVEGGKSAEGRESAEGGESVEGGKSAEGRESAEGGESAERGESAEEAASTEEGGVSVEETGESAEQAAEGESVEAAEGESVEEAEQAASAEGGGESAEEGESVEDATESAEQAASAEEGGESVEDAEQAASAEETAQGEQESTEQSAEVPGQESAEGAPESVEESAEHAPATDEESAEAIPAGGEESTETEESVEAAAPTTEEESAETAAPSTDEESVEEGAEGEAQSEEESAEAAAPSVEGSAEESTEAADQSAGEESAEAAATGEEESAEAAATGEEESAEAAATGEEESAEAAGTGEEESAEASATGEKESAEAATTGEEESVETAAAPSAEEESVEAAAPGKDESAEAASPAEESAEAAAPSAEGESAEQTAEGESAEQAAEGESVEQAAGEESAEAAEEESAEAAKGESAEAAEASAEEAASAESTPEEEELTMEIDLPENLRPREHIAQILRLDDASQEKELILSKTVEATLKELKKIYDNAIKPLEILFKYRELSNRHFGDPEIFSKPLILFMGPWSGGKSTIINYLLDNEYKTSALRTGAEPSPAYFNILMWGDTPEVVDGTQLAADWTFSGLQKFGQGMLDRLRGLRLPNKLLEKVNIVEIPGILEIRKQVERLFPFNDACQWFIDRADIIFLVYDPSKLDVGPETEAILDQLKGREYQTRIILNKADQVRPEELMRVQGTLIWNISPLMSSQEPPVMYSTSLWSMPYESGAPTRLLLAQERAFLRDLRDAVEKRVENKIASARRFAVRVRNHAKMVDCYLTTYYNHKSFFGNKKKVSDDIIEHPQDYHIYEGLSTLTNISRYDLPDPDVYRDFFRLNPLYDFQLLSSTCTYFRGCPINRLDVAIAYDLPELVGKYKKSVEAALASIQPKS